MALTPDQSDALIREVDDAVREDDIMSFWKRHGRLVAVTIALALAAYGGGLLWQSRQIAAAERNAETFAAMLKAAQSATFDEATYKTLVDSGSDAYRADAELVKAALASGKADSKAAVASYDKILGDAKAPQPMKDLALVRRTALSFDSMKPDQVIAGLKALAVPGNPWFGSAGEMSAIAYLKMNKKKEAGEMFASMSRDKQVPDSIRLRAGQMAGMLGVAPEAISSVDEQEEAVADAR